MRQMIQVSGPTPEPVATNILMGAHYFPGWSNPQKWVDATAPRHPIKGSYDELLPSVCNTQLGEMVSFGLDYVNLVWFWDAGLALPHANHWFTNYAASTVSPKPRLMLMWDNTYTTTTATSWAQMMSWLVTNYAGRGDLQRVDGKAVFIVYVPASLKSSTAAGGTDAGVRAILDAARSAGNFYFVASGNPGDALLKSGPGSAQAQGYDAVTTYNLVSGTGWPQFFRPWSDWYREVLTTCPLPCFLPMSSGWDDSVQGGTARTNPTIGEFESGLREAKAYADTYSRRVLGVCMNAWNEYIEGGVIEPATLYGGTARGLKMKHVFGK